MRTRLYQHVRGRGGVPLGLLPLQLGNERCQTTVQGRSRRSGT